MPDPAQITEPPIPLGILAKQAMEISDMARERGNLELSLEALSYIAAIQGMLDE